MHFLLFIGLSVLIPPLAGAQEKYLIKGKILDSRSKNEIINCTISLEGISTATTTTSEGTFQLSVLVLGDHILKVSSPDFVLKRIPVHLENRDLDLGTFYLEKDIAMEKADNLVTLTDTNLDDDRSSMIPGILQAARDVFLKRAAFDFGQAFFRVRGYDSQNGNILLNGIPMNKFHDGRPQWNNWGGLNDATRNQQFTHGLQPSEFNFGGILGTTNIDTRPSKMRPGTRMSSSLSNRTYGGRLMLSYTSKADKNGLVYSISTSRRWAKQGYIDGTLYDAFSVFGAIEYRFNERNSIGFTGISAMNRRGRSSALTEEVFDLVGKRYNPYWGEQNGKIRNSRERKIEEPILMLNYYFKSENMALSTGIGYQWGSNKKSRLAYFNAPNPDPTYYRYLPSFYVNSPIGANFTSANTAKEGFIKNPQLDWDRVYNANENGTAAYVYYDDVMHSEKVTLNTNGNFRLSNSFHLDFRLTYQQLQTENYAKIEDLLGANFHRDIDPFSDTRNDTQGTAERMEGDEFSYNYNMEASKIDVFAQFRFTQKRWDLFFATKYSKSNAQRIGIFQNERFESNSLGLSKEVDFSTSGLKGGGTYRINGRHSVVYHGAYLNRPPVLQNIFINPRENNQLVPDIENERITATDISYYLRLPKLTARFTGFYTRFQDLTDVNFFFVDAGIGSDFVQEVITDLDKLHKGLELGVEYQISSSVQLSAVAAIGRYNYASDPLVSINFDTAGAQEELINKEGTTALGRAQIKDYRLAQGPQQAYAFGINYRDPKYWWVSATANYLADNYAAISTITRTHSFYLNPETKSPFPNATEANVNKLLAQYPMDNFYLLNLVGGKSWLKNGKYLSIFASVNNVFDAIFRTGGYEQSRNGNFGQLQQDNLSGKPSFAPKYWYGYGRTFFLNLAYSF